MEAKYGEKDEFGNKGQMSKKPSMNRYFFFVPLKFKDLTCMHNSSKLIDMKFTC